MTLDARKAQKIIDEMFRYAFEAKDHKRDVFIRLYQAIESICEDFALEEDSMKQSRELLDDLAKNKNVPCPNCGQQIGLLDETCKHCNANLNFPL